MLFRSPVPSWDELANRKEVVELPGNSGNVTFVVDRSLTLVSDDTLAQLGLVASESKIVETLIEEAMKLAELAEFGDGEPEVFVR